VGAEREELETFFFSGGRNVVLLVFKPAIRERTGKRENFVKMRGPVLERKYEERAA